MNIRGSNIGPNRADGLRNGYVQNAGRVNGNEIAPVQASQSVSSSGDRVEISEAGRTAASDAQVRELAVARKALNGVPELGPERIDEIRQRMQDGYYSNPDVVRQMASQIANDLTGSSF